MASDASNPFFDLPALLPPPGVTSNFSNPYDLKTLDRTIAAFGIAIPTIVVGIRIYTTTCIIRKPTIDDYLICLAWITFMPYTAVVLVAVRSGVGRHQWDVRVGDTPQILFCFYIGAILYTIITMLVKSSILLQFLRIFSPPGSRNHMTYGCWGLLVFINLYYVAGFFSEVFVCIPIYKYWTPWLDRSHCTNQNVPKIASGVVNALADAIIIILPQVSIWRLKMSRKQRCKVSLIFLLGLFALAASIGRLYYTIRLFMSDDKTWHVNMMGMLAMFEFITTFVCSCTPALAKFCDHLRPSVVDFCKRLTTSASPSHSPARMTNTPDTERQIMVTKTTVQTYENPVAEFYQAPGYTRSNVSSRLSDYSRLPLTGEEHRDWV